MLALLLGAGSGVNPSQGIPGPFSFERLSHATPEVIVSTPRLSPQPHPLLILLLRDA